MRTSEILDQLRGDLALFTMRRNQVPVVSPFAEGLIVHAANTYVAKLHAAPMTLPKTNRENIGNIQQEGLDGFATVFGAPLFVHYDSRSHLTLVITKVLFLNDLIR